MPKIAIIGGGIAGLTAAWQLHQLSQEFTLYEASDRLGGTVETTRREGFTIELGPDGWVTEKPWAAELARDLGLAAELTPSLDQDRVTYIVRGGRLVPMPDGMRMMVPTDLAALDQSPLFSPEARAAYAQEPHRAEELKAAAPLLSGVFGGDVATLSVRAVMPAFVQMERDHGSLILALQAKNRMERAAQRTIFTTLQTGTQTLIDRMAAALPSDSVVLNTPIQNIISDGGGWLLYSKRDDWIAVCDHLILATPAHVTHKLLGWPELTDSLPTEATDAVIAAFAFDQHFPLPKGFGFLVPFAEPSPLLACTFVDQKYPHRAPAGKRLLRAFFGGADAPHIAAMPDEQIATLALAELETILGRLPTPAFTIIRRWPRSLPQYAVGHLDRMAQLDAHLKQTPTLQLLGNAYRGVGLPDLIRDARAIAHKLAGLNDKK